MFKSDKGDGMTEREKGAGGVIQSVEDDRRFWLQACIGNYNFNLLILIKFESANHETRENGQFHRSNRHDPA